MSLVCNNIETCFYKQPSTGPGYSHFPFAKIVQQHVHGRRQGDQDPHLDFENFSKKTLFS